MADEKVPPKDIIAVFKRLKTAGENKMCFDCRASNPTWASIPYGVFLCIDCSAVHRSLGVHLTFIRSTQLDTNWTWLQLRSMQCGGNGKANAFFRQHNLTAHDAASKYKSRVASMYREKLSNLAHKSIREYGHTLHIDQLNTPATPEQKEIDFFQDIEQNYSQSDSLGIGKKQMIENGTDNHDVDVGHLSTSPPKKDIRVPTIGNRKPAANKKKGLGVKKGGLGATKTKANFSVIETEVQQNDKLREESSIPVEPDSPAPISPNELPISSALMYKSASMKREEEKLKVSDPKKAEQLERLGMGFGNRINVSHSVSDSMQSVEQVKPNRSSRDSYRDDYGRSSEPSFFDSFDGLGEPVSSYGTGSFTEEPPSYESRYIAKGSWGQENTNKTYKSEREESTNSRSRSNKSNYSESSSDDVQKRFGNAKGISSDQLFGTNNQNDFHGRLEQYQSSNSISSAELFGEQSNRSGRTGNVDIQNLKDSVQNVTGKLSNMASGVIGSLQSRYSGNN